MSRPRDRGGINQEAKIDRIGYKMRFLSLYAVLCVSIELNLIEIS